MKINYLDAVKSFHIALGLPVGASPKQIDKKAFARRTRLICEELSEYCTAVSNDDIIKIADALADLLYVVFGAAIEHGLPMDEIFRQVHVSNMTKTAGHMDAGGKWVKPDTYIPPNLCWVKEQEHNNRQGDEMEPTDTDFETSTAFKAFKSLHEKTMVGLQREWELNERLHKGQRAKNPRGIGSSQISALVAYLIKQGIIK